MSRYEIIEIEVKVLGETEKALKVDWGGKEPIWVPKSQISDEGVENGRTTSIFIPQWLAQAKGMV